MQTRTRSRDSLIPLAIAFAVGAGILLLVSQLAHAGVGPTEATGPATFTILGLPWQSWVVIALGALALVRAIVDAALAFLKAEAPMTKTLTDDHIRDFFQGVHDRLGTLTGTVNGLVDAMKPPGAVPVLSVARNPQAGRARVSAMVAIALIGAALAGMALIGCTASQRSAAATTAGHALVNCTAQTIGTTPGLDLATLAAIANTVAAERLKCMGPTGIDWKCVETDAIGDGVTLGGCALVQLVAAASKAMSSGPSALAANPAPPPGRSELEDFRARAGGVTFHTAAGDL